MGEVLCSTENSPFLIIDHIHAKINRVCCAALAIGKRCMNVRKNKLFTLIYQDIAISDHFVPGLFRSQTISFMNYVRSWMIWPWKMSFNGVRLRKIMSRDISVTGKLSVPVISIM